MGLLTVSATYGAVVAHQLTPQSTPGVGTACTIAPRDPASFVAIAEASPIAPVFSLVDAFSASTEPAAEADTVAIRHVLDQLITCTNAGDFARTAALFTDNYWRREIGAVPGKAEALLEDARATPKPVPADQRMPQPMIIEAKILADSRLAAVVDFGVATPADSNADLVAFAQIDGQWLIDEVATDYTRVAATPPPE